MRNVSKIFFKLNFWIIILIAAQVAAIIFLCLYIPSFLPLAAVSAIVWALSAISAAVLFTRNGAPEVKCVWFVIITALPVAGALIYLLASVKSKPYGILTVSDAESTGTARAANILSGTSDVGYESAEYFPTGAEFFKSAFLAIAEAKKSVYIEFFIIGRGHIMTEFTEAMKKALKNGAQVKILLDGVGSAFKLGKRDLKRLKKAGAEVKIFHKLLPLAHSKINLRDHRKIITVDGKIAFTGGINLADEYANLTSPYGYWKDTGVVICGSAAKIFEGMFLSMWFGKYEMKSPKAAANEKFHCLPFYDSPPKRAFCEDAFVSEICRAQTRVHIMTPYFCLSDKMLSALTFTARRGVDVKVIIPHVPDKKYAFAVSKAFAHLAAHSGVKVYEYTPGFMHAKAVICDDNVFLGSYNFDFRSTHFNYECGVIFGKEICETVEKDFSECLALSKDTALGKNADKKSLKRFLLRFFSPLI